MKQMLPSPLSDFRQFVPGEPIILIDYLNELQGKENIRTVFYQMAKEISQHPEADLFILMRILLI